MIIPLRLYYFLQELSPKNMYLRRNATELKALITEGTSAATLQLLEAVSFDIDFLFLLPLSGAISQRFNEYFFGCAFI